MIFEVNQVQANGRNIFQVEQNGQVIFMAESPWAPVTPPTQRKITMVNQAGQLAFETYYNLIENIQESFLPYKYIFTGEQRFHQYSIIDAYKNYVGSLFIQVNGLTDSKLYMEYGGRVIIGYRKLHGKIEVVSLYENDMQIGQITKSTGVNDNLDRYLLHIVQGYEGWLAVLSFFTIYYDFIYNNNTGKVMVGYSTKNVYSYGKNDDKYNKDFVRMYFGDAEADRIEGKGPNSIRVQAKVGNMSMKTFWTVFALGWLVAILIALIVVIIVLL